MKKFKVRDASITIICLVYVGLRRVVTFAETIKRRGFFKPAYVLKLLDEHETAVAEHGHLFLGLLAFEM